MQWVLAECNSTRRYFGLRRHAVFAHTRSFTLYGMLLNRPLVEIRFPRKIRCCWDLRHAPNLTSSTAGVRPALQFVSCGCHNNEATCVPTTEHLTPGHNRDTHKLCIYSLVDSAAKPKRTTYMILCDPCRVLVAGFLTMPVL